MKTKEALIIEKAAHIILNMGVEALTIHNLAIEMGVDETQLYQQFTNDSDIQLMILRFFENELNEFIQENIVNSEPPEAQFKLIFKKIYFLFLQKPYYLSVIFDLRLIEKNNEIKKTFFKIKNIAATNLSEIINNGKKENIFKTNEPTKSLVRKILYGFRAYMQDEHILNEIVFKVKALKTEEKYNEL